MRYTPTSIDGLFNNEFTRMEVAPYLTLARENPDLGEMNLHDFMYLSSVLYNQGELVDIFGEGEQFYVVHNGRRINDKREFFKILNETRKNLSELTKREEFRRGVSAIEIFLLDFFEDYDFNEGVIIARLENGDHTVLGIDPMGYLSECFLQEYLRSLDEEGREAIDGVSNENLILLNSRPNNRHYLDAIDLVKPSDKKLIFPETWKIGYLGGVPESNWTMRIDEESLTKAGLNEGFRNMTKELFPESPNDYPSTAQGLMFYATNNGRVLYYLNPVSEKLYGTSDIDRILDDTFELHLK
jgi:hypothetical protein